MSIKTVLGGFALAAGLGMTAAVGLPEPTPEAPAMDAAPPTRLEVDISERKLYVHHNGEIMNTFPVAVGEPDHPTPKGNFEIDRIIWNPDWTPPPNAEWAEDKEKKDPNDPDNPMVGAKLFFEYPDYYIHGTDHVHTLGEAESHGCIRMAPADVKNLAEFVQKIGNEDRSESWFDRVKRDDESLHEVTLSDPVMVDIHQ